MIEVKVKLFASLRAGRFNVESHFCGKGFTVADLADELLLPKEQALIIFINNRHVSPETVLRDGDSVSFFPPTGGG